MSHQQSKVPVQDAQVDTYCWPVAVCAGVGLQAAPLWGPKAVALPRRNAALGTCSATQKRNVSGTGSDNLVLHAMLSAAAWRCIAWSAATGKLSFACLASCICTCARHTSGSKGDSCWDTTLAACQRLTWAAAYTWCYQASSVLRARCMYPAHAVGQSKCCQLLSVLMWAAGCIPVGATDTCQSTDDCCDGNECNTQTRTCKSRGSVQCAAIRNFLPRVGGMLPASSFCTWLYNLAWLVLAEPHARQSMLCLLKLSLRHTLVAAVCAGFVAGTCIPLGPTVAGSCFKTTDCCSGVCNANNKCTQLSTRTNVYQSKLDQSIKSILSCCERAWGRGIDTGVSKPC